MFRAAHLCSYFLFHLFNRFVVELISPVVLAGWGSKNDRWRSLLRTTTSHHNRNNRQTYRDSLLRFSESRKTGEYLPLAGNVEMPVFYGYLLPKRRELPIFC